MGAEHLGRNHDGGETLHRLTLEGVVVVAGPEAVGVVDHLEVDAATARCARFDFEAGMRCLELIEHAVNRLGLLANGWATKVRCFGEHSVVIPLDVGDVVFAQDGVHLVKHVGVGAGVRKV